MPRCRKITRRNCNRSGQDGRQNRSVKGMFFNEMVKYVQLGTAVSQGKNCFGQRHGGGFYVYIDGANSPVPPGSNMKRLHSIQADVESRLAAERREHIDRISALEADNRELASAKYRHEAAIRELRAKLAAVCFARRVSGR